MTKAALAASLRAVGVINTWDLLQRFADQKDDVAVSYVPRPAGRMGIAQYSKSQVWTSRRIGRGDAKTFAGNRAASFGVAKAWATEKYGITEWVTSPGADGGTVIPKSVYDRAVAAVTVKR